MSTKQVHITSKRIIDFIEMCLPEQRFGIDSYKTFCILVDYPPTNFSNLKSGGTLFTLQQLERISKKFNLDMNWIFGLSNKMYRGKEKVTALEQLQQSVKVIEEMLKEKPKNG